MPEVSEKIINYWVIPGIKESKIDIETFKNNLISMIQEQTGIPLIVKTRKKLVCEGRQLAAYILRQRRLTLSNIGEILNVDHATVLHSQKAITNYLKYDKYFLERWRSVLEFAGINCGPMNKVTKSRNIVNIRSSSLPRICAECTEYDIRTSFCNARKIKSYDNKPISGLCLKFNVKNKYEI